MKQNYKCLYEHDYGTWMEFQGISVFIFVKLKILEEILSMCSKKPDYWLSLLEIMQTNWERNPSLININKCGFKEKQYCFWPFSNIQVYSIWI